MLSIAEDLVKHESTSDSQIEKPIAVRFWEELQKLLKHERSQYLAIEEFVIQKDAYIRIVDDDVESDAPWLSYVLNEVTSDDSLDFGLYCFAQGLVFGIGPTTFEMPYEAMGFTSSDLLSLTEHEMAEADPKVIAQNVLLTIKLLLNGQIAVGISWRGGQMLATETFLLGYSTKPFPIALLGNFGLFRRKASDYTTKQNRLLDSHIEISDEYPLLPPVVNGQRVRRGREVDSIHDLEPLDKKTFDELSRDYSLHEYIGKPADEYLWDHFYRKTEFWIVSIIWVSILLWLKNSPESPRFFHYSLPFGVYIVVSSFVITAATGFLLAKRQRVINSGKTPITQKLESPRLLIGALSMLTLIAELFLPIWMPKSDSVHLYSAATLLPRMPGLWIIPIFSTLLILIVLSPNLFNSRKVKILMATVGILYALLPYLINAVYMNTSDNTPQPSSLLLAPALALPAVLAVVTVLMAAKNSQPQTLDN